MKKYSFYVGFSDDSGEVIRKNKFMIDVSNDVEITRKNLSFEKRENTRYLVLDYNSGNNVKQYFKLGYSMLECDIIRIICDYTKEEA